VPTPGERKRGDPKNQFLERPPRGENFSPEKYVGPPRGDFPQKGGRPPPQRGGESPIKKIWGPQRGKKALKGKKEKASPPREC